MSLDGTTITDNDREAWLAERLAGIGSSEAAAAIGLSPWQTPLELYLRKIGAMEPIIETPAMKWGTRLEPLIAAAYTEETGHTFASEQRFLRSPIHPWMTCTLDRVRTDGRIVELKTVGARGASEWGPSGSDEVPQHYIIQVLHQLICTGTEVADVAVLIGGQDFRTYTIERDDRVAERIIEREAEFWGRVQRRDPPAPDPARDGSAMVLLYPDAEGEIELGPLGEELVQEWLAGAEAVKAAQEAREKARVQLLSLMENAACARLSDGRTLTRKVVQVAEQQITRKGYEFVDLRLRTPKGA